MCRDYSKPQPRIGLTRTRMSLFAVTNSLSLLSALLQPARLPSTARWSVPGNACGSPFVTSTDGTNNTIVWVIGTRSGGDDRLHGFDGNTGDVVYAGGGANEQMAGTHSYLQLASWPVDASTLPVTTKSTPLSCRPGRRLLLRLLQ